VSDPAATLSLVPAPDDRSLDCLACTPAGPGVELALGTGWLEPRHLTGAAAVVHRRRAAGERVRVHGPADPDRGSYAARMHLGRVLDQLGAHHDLLPVRERDLAGDLLEVRWLRTAQDARLLAQVVHGKTVTRDGDVAEALWEAITELGANVQDHARGPGDPETPGFCAAQSIPSTGEVRFAVADGGSGLLATLAGRGARDDRDAIVLALSGTSRLAQPDRGRGLPNTLELVTALDGDLYVASGAASTTATSAHRVHRTLSTPFPGTLVQGRVRGVARC
jgi:hypothetical protein